MEEGIAYAHERERKVLIAINTFPARASQTFGTEPSTTRLP
jgi:collagenase-like PrtC family protease